MLIELSGQLSCSTTVKEALHKYRFTCMQSNVACLKESVRLLVDFAMKCTKNTDQLVDETILKSAEDLEYGTVETFKTFFLSICRSQIDESAY